MIKGEAAYKHTSGVIDNINEILRQDKKKKQIAKITKLYKYKFGWSRKTFMAFVLNNIPELKSEVLEEAVKNSNMTAIYAAMSKEQLSFIIKKLEFIERRNHGTD